MPAPYMIADVLEQAYPNGYFVSLIRRTYHDDPEPEFVVLSGNSFGNDHEAEDEWSFGDHEAEARAKFTELRAYYAAAPNWEAQADYDACHGEPLYIHPRASEY